LCDVLCDLRVPWAVYGQSSDFHIFLNPAKRALDPREFDPFGVAPDELKTCPKQPARALRLAMLIHGVDLSPWPGGLTSIAHDDEVVEQTAAAFEQSLARLRREAMI
jgi:glutamate-1-semialdehyde aminotransferase